MLAEFRASVSYIQTVFGRCFLFPDTGVGSMPTRDATPGDAVFILYRKISISRHIKWVGTIL